MSVNDVKSAFQRVTADQRITTADVDQVLSAPGDISPAEQAELQAQADAVVAWLRDLGYLDDEAYARARARALTAPGRLGPRAAERRLQAAGVPAPAARAAVAAALSEDGGEAARCTALAERRARGTPLGALDDRARARLARFLLGRGFSGAAVARTLGGFDDRDLEGE